MEKLTKKQETIYNIIKKYINKNGYSPTIREICKLANLRSPATIYEYLLKLKDKGYITFEENKSRTIRIKGE